MRGSTYDRFARFARLGKYSGPDVLPSWEAKKKKKSRASSRVPVGGDTYRGEQLGKQDLREMRRSNRSDTKRYGTKGLSDLRGNLVVRRNFVESNSLIGIDCGVFFFLSHITWRLLFFSIIRKNHQ